MSINFYSIFYPARDTRVSPISLKDSINSKRWCCKMVESISIVVTMTILAAAYRLYKKRRRRRKVFGDDYLIDSFL